LVPEGPNDRSQASRGRAPLRYGALTP
jgi:hypothetical protein